MMLRKKTSSISLLLEREYYYSFIKLPLVDAHPQFRICLRTQKIRQTFNNHFECERRMITAMRN